MSCPSAPCSPRLPDQPVMVSEPVGVPVIPLKVRVCDPVPSAIVELDVIWNDPTASLKPADAPVLRVPALLALPALPTVTTAVEPLSRQSLSCPPTVTDAPPTTLRLPSPPAAVSEPLR